MSAAVKLRFGGLLLNLRRFPACPIYPAKRQRLTGAGLSRAINPGYSGPENRKAAKWL